MNTSAQNKNENVLIMVGGEGGQVNEPMSSTSSSFIVEVDHAVKSNRRLFFTVIEIGVFH